MKLGYFLMQKKYCSQEQINEALHIQTRYHQKIGRILVELDYLDWKTLNSSLRIFLSPKHPYSFKELVKKYKSLSPLTHAANIPYRDKLLLLEECNESLIFASTEFDDNYLLKVENYTQKKAMMKIVSKDVFNVLSCKGQIKTFCKQIKVNTKTSDDDRLHEETPYAQLIKRCLLDAQEKQASDIHIEPSERGITIRLRVNGILSNYNHYDITHKGALTSKAKSIFNFDISITNRPQDSRASFKTIGLDIRGNSILTLNGEKIVIRLLEQSRIFSLKESELEPIVYDELCNVIQKDNGLVLLSGPTGSGKTTTLYSLLCEIDCKKKNISTLEHPIEYRLPRINQINIGQDKAISFSNALRALMRQDPDVILVGEIRDSETAKLCFQAAATGHLVMSTVHANNAHGVIKRLTGLGVDHSTIRESLTLSSAQRLIRFLCPACSTPASKELIKKSDFDCSKSNFRLASPKGCSKCDKGITGRKVIMEYIAFNKSNPYTKDNDIPVIMPLKDQITFLAKTGKIDLLEASNLV